MDDWLPGGVGGRMSLVVPIHNERENLPELVERLQAVMDRLAFEDFECLLVSDGSDDGSESWIERLVEQDGRFIGLILSRRFGHQAAVSIGLEHATGEVIAVLDGDLQDPPECLIDLVGALEQGADVAFGVRRDRKEGPLKRLAYAGFYRILRATSEITIPLDAGDFCCLRRPVLNAILRLPERNRFVRGIRAWVGFEQVGVPYERHARSAGESKYSWIQLFRLATDGLFGFTSLPIRAIQTLGLTIVLLAAVWAFGLGLLSLGVLGTNTADRTTSSSIWLIQGIWSAIGLGLLAAGILGEYLIRILDEARDRPTALVRRELRSTIVGDDGRAPNVHRSDPGQASAIGRPRLVSHMGVEPMDTHEPSTRSPKTCWRLIATDTPDSIANTGGGVPASEPSSM